MAEFGLSKAKLRLKLLGKDAPPEILFGKNAALENRTYVRLENSKDVLVASQSIKNGDLEEGGGISRSQINRNDRDAGDALGIENRRRARWKCKSKVIIGKS